MHIERKGISMKNIEKINQRDLRELRRRERQQAKVPYAAYLIVLCVVVTMIHVVDEIATNLGNMVQSSVVTEFFVTKMGLEYNEGLATMATLSILVGQLSLIAPFYKSLADRFGRKMFLVLNTSGLTLIPVSVLLYRAEMGAANPTDVFIPILIATTVATLVGLLVTCIYQRINLFSPALLAFILGVCLFFHKVDIAYSK